MRRKSMFAIVFVLFIISTGIIGQSNWTEYNINPVFGQQLGGQKAYYPSICYDPGNFSNHGNMAKYKMWYGTNDGAVGMAISDDGINWIDQGLVHGNVHYHCKIIYDCDGFGNSGYYYRMWYTDPSVWPYGSGTIKYAESIDGTYWVNEQSIIQDESKPLFDGNYWWWYGSYGPAMVLHNPDGYKDWNDSDPMGHRYIMYYNVASMNLIDGEIETTGLAYSTDGKYWKRYGEQPVLLSGADGTWDALYAYAWTVIKEDNGYGMWYSGGVSASHEGIGYATSSDGINWSKDPDNPVFHVDNSVEWRNIRTYTPSVIKEGNNYKMWFAGVGGEESGYSIGYAQSELQKHKVCIDILPGVDHNRIHENKKGLIRVVIFGSPNFSVNEIDLATVTLEGVVPVSYKIRDVYKFDPDRNISRIGHDGCADVILIFKCVELISAIGPVSNGEEVVLVLQGTLQNGIEIEGTDSVVIIKDKKKSKIGFSAGETNPPGFQFSETVPNKFTLFSNYPNPFNPTTTIRYDIPKASQVTLTIYNMNGQVVERLVNKKQEPGFYSVNWDARNLSTGVYFYQIQAGDFQQVKKMILLK